MKTFYVHFFDDITRETVNLLISKISDVIREHKPETLYFLISSHGGCPKAGMVLFNFLMTIPVEVITHCTGVLHSAAVVPFLAGSKRVAYPHSQFLIHRIQSQNTSHRSALQVAEQLRLVESGDMNSIAVMHMRTGMAVEDIQKFYLESHVFDNVFAESNGFIHETCATRIASMDDLITISSPKV